MGGEGGSAWLVDVGGRRWEGGGGRNAVESMKAYGPECSRFCSVCLISFRLLIALVQ